MRSIVLCLVVVLMVCGGVQSSNVNFLSEEFPSKFLNKTTNANGILRLMNTHFVNSLDYLYAGKFYGSQGFERPGLAKLLTEESDRHWEEGMNVLKKYLDIGGTTIKNTFFNNMEFTRKNDMFEQTAGDKAKYKTSLKKVMTKSRELGQTITDLYHDANHRVSGSGDVDVAHFLADKAEKESEVARKMVGHYITLQKMVVKGIAFDIFDQNL